MNPDALFPIVNLLPLPIWFVWVALPKSALARRLADSLWPWGILAALYALSVLMASLEGGPGPEAFFTLSGVMTIFDFPWPTMAGWLHYLCFDLFCARWMLHDAPDAGYALSPILLLTLFYGPIGLLVYLALRTKLRLQSQGQAPMSAA